jgi:hypothetical protein
VVRATTLARMLYASPVWWGFIGQGDRDLLQSVMRRLVRFHYLPSDTPFFAKLCSTADSTLFTAVLKNGGHVLHYLLPPVKTIGYHLRPRAHNRSIPPADGLMRKTFIIRMIYGFQDM